MASSFLEMQNGFIKFIDVKVNLALVPLKILLCSSNFGYALKTYKKYVISQKTLDSAAEFRASRRSGKCVAEMRERRECDGEEE